MPLTKRVEDHEIKSILCMNRMNRSQIILSFRGDLVNPLFIGAHFASHVPKFLSSVKRIGVFPPQANAISRRRGVTMPPHRYNLPRHRCWYSQLHGVGITI
jgi:hypothetical protein